MHVLRVRNVNEALPTGLRYLRECGVSRDSRNGPVLQAPEPVCTLYERPQERVLYDAYRDANPFFHLYESLWMLAGRRDVKPLARYVKRMETFADGEFLNAAYGYRWRRARGIDENVGHDQIATIAEALRQNPLCRQQVLQIWDHAYDLGTVTNDHACNLVATFQASPRSERWLDMTVFCRSNDIVWGAYGANAVHFSILHEYVAGRAGLEVGAYRQVSVNYHAYVATIPKDEQPYDPYAEARVSTHPLGVTPANAGEWDEECRRFVTKDGRAPDGEFRTPFFGDVALPIVRAFDAYRSGGSIQPALHELEVCAASDWQLACSQWLARRIK